MTGETAEAAAKHRSAFTGAPMAWALSLGALGAALLLRYLLDPLVGDALPFITMFGAVAAAVWLGGYRPALLVVVLGYLAIAYLFVEFRGAGPAWDRLGGAVGLVAYLFTCSLIIAIGETARRSHTHANERRELLRLTLQSIGDAVITTDAAGRINTMNTVAESLTGWTEVDATGRPLDDVFRIVSQDTRQPVENPALKALRQGVVVGLANHTVLLQKGGGECAIDDSASPIVDEDGEISGSVLIFRDVTAQRRIERERADELLTARVLASIIETSDDAIISKSLDGTIRSWNAGAERLFGYTAEQAVGRHISLVIPPERIAEEDHIVASLKAGQRIDHFETERVGADGRRVIVSLTISPIKNEAGEVVGASKIVRDVTSQRQSEQRERLLLSETASANAKFQAFFEQGALFAGIMDVNGTLIEANRLSWEACGFVKEQVIGKPFWEGPWWMPAADLVDEIRTASQQAAAGHTFRKEMPYFVGDGSQRTVDVTILPIRDEDGRILFLAPTGIDVTERKRAEADRERFAADLAEADRRKTEFLAMLAHELRNPLAPISNAAKVLRLGGRGDGALDAASAMLERQIAQMGRLVDDLLDMSRITRGRIELRKERVDCRTIVDQAVETTRALYKSMGHGLDVTLPEQPVYIDADPARLAQVIGNLLNNACKFTDRNGHISLTVCRDDHQVVLSVRDNGIGIAAEHLPNLFDMFAQVDTSLERSRDGLGIGLTLVKTLVELHGGTVHAHSDGIGRGSQFTIRLPVPSDAALPAAQPAASKPAAAGGRRVLIVDDSEDGAESLAMLLRFGGHDTHKAHDGIEAIKAAERLRPDAVLLDIGLPGLNGYEVCKRLRQQSWGKGLVIIALTGWGQDEDRHRSKEAGFDAHMVKPVDHEALLKLLDSLPSTRPEPTFG